MRTFFSTFFGILLLIAGLNYGMDLAHRWHKRPRYFDRNWGSQEVWLAPDNFEEAALRVRQLKLIDPPQLLALGSSRVLFVDSEMFRTGGFYNAGAPAASPIDFIAFWQTLKEAHQAPARVLLFLDPWAFSPALPATTSMASLRAYERFLWNRRHDPAARAQWLKTFLYRITLVGNEVSDLLSWEVTKASWNAWRKNTGPSREVASASPGGIIRKNERPAAATAWRNDGAEIPPDSQVAPPPTESITKQATEYSTSQHWTLVEMAAGAEIPPELEWLLSDMKESGTRVMAVLPPFQPSALRGFRDREAVWAALKRSEELTKKLSSRFSLSLCDRIDIDGICRANEFMDGYHMLRSCAEKVVRSCFLPEPEWRDLLSQQQLSYWKGSQ